MLSCMLRDLGGLAPTSLFVFSFVGPVALWGLVWVKCMLLLSTLQCWLIG